MYRLKRRNCIVSLPRRTGILKWVARNQKANSPLGGKGGSSLIVQVLVIVFYVVIDVIFYTLRCTDDAVPLLKILLRTVELLKHQCLRTVTYEPLVMMS